MRIALILNSVFFAVLAGLNFCTYPNSAENPPAKSPFLPDRQGRFRPIAVELDNREQRLVVASSDGQVAVLDTETKKLLSKTLIGKELADLCRLSNDGKTHFLAVDRQTHQLLNFQLNSDHIPKINWRLEVCKYPSRIAVNRGGLIAVAGHWSRKLTFVLSSNPGQKPKIIGHLDLDFVPGQLAWLGGDKDQLLVVDAYGNRQSNH